MKKPAFNVTDVLVVAILAGFVLLGIVTVAAQEIRRPRARRIPGVATETTTPTQTPTATPTPDPDPCAACPDPDSFSCTIAWSICVQCWEDCGQPIATPTPTPTETPPPTPTPNGPACEIIFPTQADIYLVAFYAHESTTRGTRYTHQTAPASVPPGSTVRPCPCEGYPIGFEWRAVNDNRILKSCGDTSSIFSYLFADGFESGDVEKWSSSNP